MIDYIDTHRDRFGVEPICTVLAAAGVPIAPQLLRGQDPSALVAGAPR